jgi:hypothetical protein
MGINLGSILTVAFTLQRVTAPPPASLFLAKTLFKTRIQANVLEVGRRPPRLGMRMRWVNLLRGFKGSSGSYTER